MLLVVLVSSSVQFSLLLHWQGCDSLCPPLGTGTAAGREWCWLAVSGTDDQ